MFLGGIKYANNDGITFQFWGNEILYGKYIKDVEYLDNKNKSKCLNKFDTFFLPRFKTESL